jgi:GTPase
MLIDDITIRVRAGSGGKGAVAFNKNKNQLGPTGGSGGIGGNVIFEGVNDIGALRTFRNKKSFEAEDGRDGRGQFRDGHDGENLVLKVPVGTVIHNLSDGSEEEITLSNEQIVVAEGGNGGKGNFLFRSPRNTSPKQFQDGLPGEEFDIRLELKLIADVGFVGLPNVGKSSLLNELTRAHARVANYRFTTLEPNLGVYFALILADIPGLIEGASDGKGLGIKFLRHIERTKVLFHFIDAESRTPVKDYRLIRKELERFNKKLLKKPEYIIVSRTDLVSPETLDSSVKKLEKLGDVYPLSIHDWDSFKKLKKLLDSLTHFRQ